MADTDEKTTATQETTEKSQHAAPAERQQASGTTRRREGGGNNKGNRRGKRFMRRSERPRPEFEQKILSIRRVSRVVAGGRRFSFSVTIALGDQKGAVGVGLGKAGDTALAIEKAANDAKKNMLVIPRTKDNSIPHPVQAKFCGSALFIQPSPGRGLVAGSSVRNVLQLAGITNIVAKLTSRSSNQLNNARATMAAFEKITGVRRYADVKRERSQARDRAKEEKANEETTNT